MDPNDPYSPLAPDILIKQTIEGVPYWFESTDSVSGEPADIYGITAIPEIGYVCVKVADKFGGPGARNVGKVPSVENHVFSIEGDFSAASVARSFHVFSALEGNLMITGDGPHGGTDIGRLGAPYTITISGSLPGNIQLGE